MSTKRECKDTFDEFIMEKKNISVFTKKFSKKNNLVSYFRIHFGEKLYSCANCRKWFTKASGRNYHIRNRHNEKKNIKTEM